MRSKHKTINTYLLQLPHLVALLCSHNCSILLPILAVLWRTVTSMIPGAFPRGFVSLLFPFQKNSVSAPPTIEGSTTTSVDISAMQSLANRLDGQAGTSARVDANYESRHGADAWDMQSACQLAGSEKQASRKPCSLHTLPAMLRDC
ncbi:uncharacterized protein GIQ15_01338 [Arthroderma uncinatum]|uniref:uncharacterized protein n=1 Tax=Arthroderma uncinatum TaxID=74035 RepID=UPI00144A5EED|nr:uncharacterized protein GIQ15_01338 [Arthroderma uncinatum]KAF3491821.1 hypothetical protein GIQ15_01338 [Arthroderma uncinatum]